MSFTGAVLVLPPPSTSAALRAQKFRSLPLLEAVVQGLLFSASVLERAAASSFVLVAGIIIKTKETHTKKI